MCSRRVAEARVAVEAAPRSQTDEDLARTPLQPLLHLDGIVARIEDEQGSSVSFLARTTGRSRNDLTCSAATTLASWAGRTRSTSTGAVQLSRTKFSCATNW